MKIPAPPAGPKGRAHRLHCLALYGVAAGALVFLAVASAFAAGDGSGAHTGSSWDIELLIGQKFLDSNEWEPVETQREVGLILGYTRDTWPLGLVAEVFASRAKEQDDGVEWKSLIIEFGAGVRKVWRKGKRLRPFLGGGGGIIYTDLKRTVLRSGRSSTDNGDMTRSLWVDAGTKVFITPQMSVGLGGRLSIGNNIALFGSPRDPGGWHLNLSAGYHW